MAKDATDGLSGIALFRPLSGAQRAAIARRCAFRSFAPDEQIIDRQSDSQEVFFIVSGQVRVVNYSRSGREITFDVFSEGDHFGQFAAIDGAPRSASVQAIDKVTVATLEAKVFVDILKTQPMVTFLLLEETVRIVRSATDRIMDLSTLGANARVQAELLRKARQNMTGDNAALIFPIPIHADIAGQVSTARETVARVLGDLTRKGIVRKTKQGLHIQDVDRLEEMVRDVRGE